MKITLTIAGCLAAYVAGVYTHKTFPKWMPWLLSRGDNTW